MGLDMVEFILAVEEEFDVAIADDEWYELTTVDKVTEHIANIYDTNLTPQRAFYNFRTKLMKEFKFKKRELKPSTHIEDLFVDNIQEKWTILNRLLDEQLNYFPLKFSLKYHSLIVMIIFGISTLLYYGIYFYNELYWEIGLFFAIFFTPITSAILYKTLQKKWVTIVPKELKKLASFIRFEHGSKKQIKYHNRAIIYDKVMEMAIEEFGVAPESINCNTDFIKDLKID